MEGPGVGVAFFEEGIKIINLYHFHPVLAPLLKQKKTQGDKICTFVVWKCFFQPRTTPTPALTVTFV